jgi:hypothetical protein
MNSYRSRIMHLSPVTCEMGSQTFRLRHDLIKNGTMSKFTYQIYKLKQRD